MNQQTKKHTAYKVSFITILWNILLSIFKLFVGIFAHSGALVSDAIHSASDVLSTFIVLIGIKFATKASDKEHPYGHERMECVAAILLAVILGATGLGIGYSGLQTIIEHDTNIVTVPGTLALVAAFISIVVKEAMYWYTRAAAKKINSGALMADAWHHRSDALSSVGSFIGILGAQLGFPIMDPIASVVICLFIIKAACDIFIDAIGKMVDKACDDETIKKIEEVIVQQQGVLGIDKIKTRLFGDKIYVDIEIQANGDDTLRQTHDIAQCTHDAIEEYIPNVKHCMVHVNPVNLPEE